MLQLHNFQWCSRSLIPSFFLLLFPRQSYSFYSINSYFTVFGNYSNRFKIKTNLGSIWPNPQDRSYRSRRLYRKNLRRYLSEKNVELISVSRNDFVNFKCEAKIISRNYIEGGDILEKIRRADALVHLVGIGSQSAHADYDTINTGLTAHVVNLGKKAGIKKIIFLSGLGVSPHTPLSYFISKYNAEKQIIDSGLDFTIFRPSYIVGKDDLLSQKPKKTD